MKRCILSFALAGALILLLAACNPAAPEQTAAPTSPVGTEIVGEETESVAPTTVPVETEAPTEAPTGAPTATAGAETTEEPVEETPAETGTPGAEPGGAGGEGEAGGQPGLEELMDFPVRFANSSVRGEVTDFVLDLEAQQVEYLLVNINAAAAGGERLVPIPWSALALDSENNNFSLGFNLVTAADAPVVDPEAGIDFTNPEWEQEILAFWETQGAPGGEGETETGTPGAGEADATGTPEAGTPAATATEASEEETGTPAAGGAEAAGTPEGTETAGETPAGGQEPRYILASEVFNANIHFGTGAETGGEGGTPAAPASLGAAIGRVEDLRVDTESGEILFVLASPADALGLEGEVWVPVPANLLSPGPRPGTLVLNASQEAIDLQNLPTIDPNQLPGLDLDTWLEQFRAFWGATP